jgi:hypothetical protein
LAILRDLDNRNKHKLLQMVYGVVNAGNLGLVGEIPDDGRTCQVVASADEIKDGAEIYATIFSCPTPNMRYDRTELNVVAAIRHGKRDPADPPWTDRTDFSALYSALAGEVRQIVYDVSAKVI